MKVVINKCYGGFGLSPAATKRWAELHGRKCYFYWMGHGNLNAHTLVNVEDIDPSSWRTWVAYDIPNVDEVLSSQENWHEQTMEQRQESNKIWDSHSIETGTNDGAISAAFGLARSLSAEGNRIGAVRTLDEVPPTSRHFTTAHLTSAVTLLSGRSTSEITEGQIRDAARRVEALPPTEPRVLQIRALVLGGAMDWLGDNEASTNHILGFPFTQHGLRLGVEASLRSLARVAPTQRHRYTLVDMANNVRPTSTF